MAIKKNTVLMVIFLLVVSVCLNGCATAKGVATGMGETAKGVAEDAKGLWQGISKLDAWIKKNLW